MSRILLVAFLLSILTIFAPADAIELIKPGFGTSEYNLSSQPKESNPYIVRSLTSGKCYMLTFKGGSYITSEGATFGHTQQDVLKRYSNDVPLFKGTTILYFKRGIGFNFKSDKLSEIFVFYPHQSKLSGDELIVPGVRVGEIRLGTFISDVIKILGTPSSITDCYDLTKKKLYFYDLRYGLIFMTERGRIIKIVILTPVFKFKEGIAVGNSVDEAQKRLGTGKIVDDVIIYDQFLLKSEGGVISEIDLLSK